jgi:hypothetical protein
VWIFAGISAGTHPRIDLELLDQKVRGVLVPIALKRLFFEHAQKVFGEMSVST